MIDSNSLRIPVTYNLLDVLRRSQSATDLYTKKDIFSVMKDDSTFLDVAESAISKDSGLSFFISESESKYQKNEKEKQFLVSPFKCSL